MTNRPDLAAPGNALEALELLRGLTYPASKADVLEHARRNHAVETVLERLSGLPERTYASGEELAESLGTALPPSAAGSGPRGQSAAGDDLAEHPAAQSAPDRTF